MLGLRKAQVSPRVVVDVTKMSMMLSTRLPTKARLTITEASLPIVRANTSPLHLENLHPHTAQHLLYVEDREF